MPTVALLSDIHSNREALDAVLAQLAGVDRTLCLGDVVGYGPDPVYCIERLAELDIATVLGNHDEGVLREIGDESMVLEFNPDALAALMWNKLQLAPEHVEFLKALPLSRTFDEIGLSIVHASPPDSFTEYLDFDSSAVRAAMRQCGSRFCAVGHTHLPALALGPPARKGPRRRRPFTRRHGGEQWEVLRPGPQGHLARLEPGQRVLLNPGSVGQPRDGSAMASFAVIDTDRHVVEVRRVPYDVTTTQAKIREVGLPEWLAVRLEMGR
jgi:diadenosine tetraphosphatase ApaH/serine/threonine PP2A family protein phosphatase